MATFPIDCAAESTITAGTEYIPNPWFSYRFGAEISRIDQILEPRAGDLVSSLIGKCSSRGAGYMAKGMYRPQPACWMGNGSPTQGFCVVCQQGIGQMIDYYAPEK